jgi:hypothetical protein
MQETQRCAPGSATSLHESSVTTNPILCNTPANFTFRPTSLLIINLIIYEVQLRVYNEKGYLLFYWTSFYQYSHENL